MSERPVNIVVMDLTLPYLSGTAATRQIREAHPHIPIVGMSAYATPENVQFFLDAGGTVFVDKRDIDATFPEQLKSLL